MANSVKKETNPKDIIGGNKLPLHLCPLTLIVGVCLAFLEGALKYGRSNWRVAGVKASIYYDALQRHIQSWWEGEDIDAESGLPHLFKAAACIAILIDAKEAGKLNDDRMVKGGYADLVKKYTSYVPKLKEIHKDKNPKHYTIQDNKEE